MAPSFALGIARCIAKRKQGNRRGGRFYGIPIGKNPGQQDYQRGPALVPGQWNTYEIEVRDNTYTVRLNGQQTTKFTNTDLFRGRSSATDLDSGYIGVQSHTGRVTFRNVQIMAQAPAAVTAGAGGSKMEALHEEPRKKAAKTA